MLQDTALKNISEIKVKCPHCGHHLFLTLDATKGDQDYYDECPACCKEMHLTMHIDEYHQKVELMIESDDEQVF